MSWATLSLLVLAACLHVGAHVAYKRATHKLAFMWCWLLWVLAVFSPVLLTLKWNWAAVAWAVLLVSALGEAAYIIAASIAYTRGDLSVVYPLSRGSAPLFIALWAGLFLGERPSPAGWLGIALIVLGLYLLNLRSLRDIFKPLASLQQAGSRWALLGGVFISVYSTVDKIGVQYIPPLPYLYLVLLGAWLALTPACWAGARRAATRQEWRANKWAALAAGVSTTLAYTLVLAAIQHSKVSYVGAVREMSVVLGAWIGAVWLREGQAALRVPASALAAAGIILIAAAG